MSFDCEVANAAEQLLNPKSVRRERIPCFEAVERFLEKRGWKRAIAGNKDFEAAVRAIILTYETGKGLLVSGEYGVGKTALIKALVPPDAFKVQLGISIEPLKKEWQEMWAENPLEKSVFLDDLGAEPRVNEYGVKLELAADFITFWHDRHAPGKRMLITTNYNSEEMDIRYGGRLTSRLKDLCVAVRLTGEDKRKWVF